MVGALKKRAAPTLAPFAGFTKGSSSVSASAIETPPIPKLLDGKIANWSPWAIGTVLIEMSCGGARRARGISNRGQKPTARSPPPNHLPVVIRRLAPQGFPLELA